MDDAYQWRVLVLRANARVLFARKVCPKSVFLENTNFWLKSPLVHYSAKCYGVETIACMNLLVYRDVAYKYTWELEQTQQL